MNGVIDWGDFTPNTNRGNGDRLDFLWLKSGSSYKVRLVAKPVIFYKYFYKNNGKLRTAICDDPRTCPVGQNHPELETPSERFAILAIDRSDSELKVMEFPKSVFLSIKAWWQACKQSPGGEQGVDWVIQVTGSGKQGTKYIITPTVPAPFTEEEKAKIIKVIKTEAGEPSDYLQNTFKHHSPEVIEKRLFGEWEDRSNPTAAAPQQAVAQPVAQPVPAAQPAPTVQSTDNIDW